MSSDILKNIEFTEIKKRHRLIILDFLRGIAAIFVAALHVSDRGPIKVPSGFAMLVLFFFILSGFVLTYAYGEDLRKQKIDLIDFIILRFARLYPLHFITLFVVALLIYLAHATSQEIRSSCGAREFFEAVGLTQLFFGGSHCFNVPSWSITTEFWCGGVIVALSVPEATRFRRYIVMIALALFIWGATFGFMRSGPTQHLFGPGCFVIGWWLCYLRPAPPAWAYVGLLAFVASVTLMFVGVTNDIVYVGLFTVVIAFLANVNVVQPMLAGTMSAIGDWSYGIYMWHWPLLLALGGLDAIFRKFIGIGIKNTMAFQLIFFVMLFPIAAVSYKYIELPSKRAIKHLAQAGRQVRLI